jgi:hemerythrin-like domain-containing protein
MAKVNETAIDLLTADHEKVRSLLEELSSTTTRGTKTRRSLLERLGSELRAHAKIEEEIFYPAVREAAKKKEHEQQIAEALEEHRAVEKLVLPDLERTAPDTVEFGGRAKVLKELVEHHADEEEKELFKTAKELLSKDELRELGARMRERKEALLAEASS